MRLRSNVLKACKVILYCPAKSDLATLLRSVSLARIETKTSLQTSSISSNLNTMVKALQAELLKIATTVVTTAVECLLRHLKISMMSTVTQSQVAWVCRITREEAWNKTSLTGMALLLSISSRCMEAALATCITCTRCLQAAMISNGWVAVILHLWAVKGPQVASSNSSLVKSQDSSLSHQWDRPEVQTNHLVTYHQMLTVLALTVTCMNREHLGAKKIAITNRIADRQCYQEPRATSRRSSGSQV